MSPWNFRVVKHVYKTEEYSEDHYSIHEHYFELGSDSIGSITQNAIAPRGGSIEELKRELQRMLDACDKPALLYTDFATDE